MKEKFSNMGVLTGAFLASICCIGPIVLASLGIGGAGFALGFEAYRPYFIGFTVVALGMAYYFTYRKREVACEDGSCEMHTGSRRSKIVLWSLTALAAFFISFPYLNLNAHEEFDFSTLSPEFTTIIIPVEGMTCDACNTAIEMAVGKLDGVQGIKADFEIGEAMVAYDEQMVGTQNIIDAINNLGYKAKKPNIK